MRILVASVVLGPLLLSGVPRVAVAQSAAPPPPIPLPADNDADRGPYTQNAQEDMDQWQQKLHDFGEKAKATGQQGAAAAKENLDTAFTKAKVAAEGLKTAGANGWQNAKMSFEKAKHDLADTWDRIKPQ
jgi:type IV secretory pathway VirB10-like protein